MIRVLLSDDQPLVRAGLRVLFEGEQDIAVVAEAAHGEAALQLARQTQPDVALMDIRMPVMDGLQATREIAADPQLAAVRVLILTTFESDEYVFEALRAGASGFLLKDAEPTELLQAVRVIAAGDALLSPSVTRRLIARFLATPEHEPSHPEQLDALTERERQIMAVVARGSSNDEIADLLTISPATVKTHVSRAMVKLGARDRAQLVVLAYESGLVSPNVPATRGASETDGA
jgi:DNA-binding NarL/FixJ family response regulator